MILVKIFWFGIFYWEGKNEKKKKKNIKKKKKKNSKDILCVQLKMI